MNVEDVAEFLKCTTRQVFELTRKRSQVRGRHPLPCIKIHRKMLRFRRSDVTEWLDNIAADSQSATADRE